MEHKCTIRLLFFLIITFASCTGKKANQEIGSNDPKAVLANWVIEDESDHILATAANGITEIISPEGLTLWYNKELTGEYEISYLISVIMEGGHFDRLSDMNCFWTASDPKYPNNLFERSEWRKGIFGNYNTLNLFYVGYGGNENTTTRFRRYHGEYYDTDSTKIKPLLQEYTDAAHLLKPDRLYRINIKVTKNETSFSVDNEVLFTLPLKEGEGNGYFGLRLLTNHIQFMSFEVKQLNSPQ